MKAIAILILSSLLVLTETKSQTTTVILNGEANTNPIYSDNSALAFNQEINLGTEINETKESKITGKVIYTYENGNARETGFITAGKRNGNWTKWDETGHKISEANYSLGKKDGKWIIWDETGAKRYEMFYKKGERIKTWTIWNQDGTVQSERKYTE
jgi:antitoxin component YwqK of YwqJK toxin-antitoxin module